MKTQDKEPEVDPFLCRCRKCKGFWQKTFHGAVTGGRRGSAGVLLSLPPEERVARTSMMYSHTRRREDHPAVLKVGDRVIVGDTFIGVVKFVGILDENITAPDTYVGVKTDDHIGSRHNGVFGGKRFFHCPRGHGLMVKYAEVIRINPPERCPPIAGNPMFPSYAGVRRQRLERSMRDPANYWSPHKKQPIVFICDADDVAAKDLKQQEQREKRRQQMTQEREQNQRVRADAASKQSLNKYKEQFGGGSRGQVMARTLQKLHKAYEQGLELMQEEQEQQSNYTGETESMYSDYYSSLA